MGALTDAIRRLLPRTYDAMVAASGAVPKAGQYTVGDVQALADYAKSRLWASVANVTEEVLYAPQLVQFIARYAALDFIPAAIDYWDRQVLSENTTGSNENLSYPNAPDSLLRLFTDIRKMVAEDFEAMAAQYGFQSTGTVFLPKVSYYDNGRDIFVTRDPMDFPPNRMKLGGVLFDDLLMEPIPWSFNEDVAG